jgi:hypothetical protein
MGMALPPVAAETVAASPKAARQASVPGPQSAASRGMLM